MTDSVLDILMGGSGYPAADFQVIGAVVEGTIVGTKGRQVREYDAANPGQGAPKFFGSGDPIMGVVIDLDTGIRTGPDDTGIRRIYADTKRAKDALREAIVNAGAIRQGLEVGGRLRMQWTGEDRATAIPAKTWAATYVPPAAAAANAALAPTVTAYAPAPTVTAYAPTTYTPAATYAPAPTPAPVAYAPTTYTPAATYAPAPTPAPVAYAPTPAVAPQAPTGRPVITGIQAAAMANAGVDVSQFEIVG